MALFEVPGWSMPMETRPTSALNTKKRKRPSGPESEKVQTIEINIEKLMKKLDKEIIPRIEKKDSGAVERPVTSGTAKVGRKGKKHDARVGRIPETTKEDGVSLTKKTKKGKDADFLKTPDISRKNGKLAKGKNRDGAIQGRQSDKETGSKEEKKEKFTAKSTGVTNSSSKPPATSKPQATNLTALQANMKQSLDGARFRWINEVLYKSDSADAQRMMREDPNMYEEYHTGFRHQVTSWPSNPVSHYISSLSSYPARTVIVDLGCGDAALARELVPKGFNVLSYDLVSDGAFVIAVDICGKLPLPGSEDASFGGQIVDVVVCALSLMSTNWLNCIREARKVLKSGGELKIAEVTSRFTDVSKFTSMICSLGFRLVSKDERNSHFSLFDFKKIDRALLTDNEWKKMLMGGEVLQPCEYKRR